MKLNHINLTVNDVSSAFDFFETHFGFVLSLMNLQDDSEVNYLGMFHIGFIQESKEKVDEINGP